MSVFSYRRFGTDAVLIIAGLFLYLAISETILVWRFQRKTNILQKIEDSLEHRLYRKGSSDKFFVTTPFLIRLTIAKNQ